MKKRKHFYLTDTTIKQIEKYAKEIEVNNSVAVQILVGWASQENKNNKTK